MNLQVGQGDHALTRTVEDRRAWPPAPGTRSTMLAAVNVLGSMKRSNWTKNPSNWGTPVTGSRVLIMVGPPGGGSGTVRGVATPIVLLTTRGPAAIRKGAIRISSRFVPVDPAALVARPGRVDVAREHRQPLMGAEGVPRRRRRVRVRVGSPTGRPKSAQG